MCFSPTLFRRRGLRKAAEQINQVRDQISPLTKEMGIFVIGDAPRVRKTPGGAVSIFAGEPDDEESPADAPGEDERQDEDGEERRPTEPEPLIVLPDDKPRQVKTGDGRTAEMWRSGEYKYPLRNISGLSRRLQTAIFNTDKASSLTRDVVDRFMLDDTRIVQLAHRQAAQVCRETLEIFQQVHMPPEILSADLAMAELRRMAQRKFGGDVDGHGYLQEREFRRLMRDRLRDLADKNGWTDMTDKLVEEWMIKILAFEPRAMKQAISRVIAGNLTTRETDAPLPKFLRSEDSLIPARRKHLRRLSAGHERLGAALCGNAGRGRRRCFVVASQYRPEKMGGSDSDSRKSGRLLPRLCGRRAGPLRRRDFAGGNEARH